MLNILIISKIFFVKLCSLIFYYKSFQGKYFLFAKRTAILVRKFRWLKSAPAFRTPLKFSK